MSKLKKIFEKIEKDKDDLKLFYMKRGNVFIFKIN